MRAPRLRKAFLLFLAFTYLFVGLVHAPAHATESAPAAIALEMAGAAADDDADSKKSSAVVEHCQIYAPTLMPALAPVAARSARSVQLVFLTPNLLLEDHLWLDTPPPKHLT